MTPHEAWLEHLERHWLEARWPITGLSGHELRRLDRQRALLATPRAVAYAGRHGYIKLGEGTRRAYAPAAQ